MEKFFLHFNFCTKEEVKIGNIMNFKANKKTNKPKEMARTKRIYWILKY